MRLLLGVAGGPRPARRGGLWGRLFCLLAVVCGTWSLALPLMTGPDEYDHAVRAAAVARGHPLAAGNPRGNMIGHVEAPESYLMAGNIALCWYWKGEPRESRFGEFDVTTPPRHCPEMDDGTEVMPVPTYEYRSQPLYYLVVGLPSLATAGPTGVYLGRLVAATICAGFLASGLTSLLQARRRALTVLGAGVALTPSVLYFAGSINPIGLEIATAFAAWAGAAALAVHAHDTDESDRRLVRRTGLALVVLTLTRGLSPAFAGLVVLALVVMSSGTRRRELWGRRDVRLWLGTIGLAVVASGAWVLFIDHRYPLKSRDGTGLGYAIGQVDWWLQEATAVFGATTVVPPAVLHLLWLVAVAVVVGLVLGERRRRRPLLLGLALAAAGVALLVSGEGLSVPQTGYWWQGRYVLPLLVGAPLLATSAPVRELVAGRATSVSTTRLSDRVGPLLLAFLVALQVWSFVYAVRHYTVGHDGPANPFQFLFDRVWSPPLLPPWLYVLGFGAGLAALTAVMWRAATAPADAAEPDYDAHLDAEPASGSGELDLPPVRQVLSTGPRPLTKG